MKDNRHMDYPSYYRRDMEPVAIVGIACRFPKAANIREFWQFLNKGTDPLAGALVESSQNDQSRNIPADVKDYEHILKGGFLADKSGFDWRAWRMLPREVKYMDPQHRLLMELSWEAFEDAGMPLSALDGLRCAVYTSVQWNDYFRLLSKNLAPDSKPSPESLSSYTIMGNAHTFAANRISYAFGLRGPSCSVDSGCSSSLSALQLACQSIWSGDVECALVGSAELMLSEQTSLFMASAGLLSKQGVCRTWDENADGFVRSEGGGVTVLKPLSSVKPWERVYAAVRSVAVNHNGHNEWIMASNQCAQEELMRESCKKAGVSPEDIEYVELHGAGNKRGDPVEFNAIANVYGLAQYRKRPCFIGAVKSTLGHTGGASAMAGLIKTALVLHQGIIPPTPKPQQINSQISLDRAGVTINEHATRWSGGGSRLAAVNALSLGGVNGHAVLEQHKNYFTGDSDCGLGKRKEKTLNILPLSAMSTTALRALVKQYRDFIKENRCPLQDCCFTAAIGRDHFKHRFAAVGYTRQEILNELNKYLSLPLQASQNNGRFSKIVWRVCNADTTGEINEMLNKHSIVSLGVVGADKFIKLLDTCSQVIETLRCEACQKTLIEYWIRQILTARQFFGFGIKQDKINTPHPLLELRELLFSDTVSELKMKEVFATILTHRDYYLQEDTQSQQDEFIGLWDSGVAVLEFTTNIDEQAKGENSNKEFVIPLNHVNSALEMGSYLSELYCLGIDLDWAQLCRGTIVSAPNYQWQRENLWPEWLAPPFSTPVDSDSPYHLSKSTETSETGIGIGDKPLFQEALHCADKVESRDMTVIALKGLMARLLDLPEDLIDDKKLLTQIGIDSLSGHELTVMLEKLCGFSPDLAEVLAMNLAELAALLVEKQDLFDKLQRISGDSGHETSAGETEKLETIRL